MDEYKADGIWSLAQVLDAPRSACDHISCFLLLLMSKGILCIANDIEEITEYEQVMDYLMSNEQGPFQLAMTHPITTQEWKDLIMFLNVHVIGLRRYNL